MAGGDLFRGFLVRFSMKKDQHVRMLQKFEDNRLNGGKAKTQIIMDALEMYYHALENDGGAGGDEPATMREVEQRLARFRQEIKEEMAQELFRMIISSMTGQPVPAAALPTGKPEQEEMREDGAVDISGMPDIMDKIMDWSEN